MCIYRNKTKNTRILQKDQNFMMGLGIDRDIDTKDQNLQDCVKRGGGVDAEKQKKIKQNPKKIMGDLKESIWVLSLEKIFSH